MAAKQSVFLLTVLTATNLATGAITYSSLAGATGISLRHVETLDRIEVRVGTFAGLTQQQTAGQICDRAEDALGLAEGACALTDVLGYRVSIHERGGNGHTCETFTHEVDGEQVPYNDCVWVDARVARDMTLVDGAPE